MIDELGRNMDSMERIEPRLPRDIPARLGHLATPTRILSMRSQPVFPGAVLY